MNESRIRPRPYAREDVRVQTGAEAAAFDRRAIEEVGVPQPVLMENAGRSAARDALREEVGLRGPKSEGISDEERTARWETFRQRTGEVDAEFPPADVAVYCDHIDHIVEVAGIDHVGIGSDFDGGGGIGGWQNAAESRNVTRELVKRGYSEQDIQKIWSVNLLRVWRAVEAVSAGW